MRLSVSLKFFLESLEKYLVYWVNFGFLWFVLGFFLIQDNGRHTPHTYLGISLPIALMLLINPQKFISRFRSNKIGIVVLLYLVYSVLSSIFVFQLSEYDSVASENFWMYCRRAFHCLMFFLAVQVIKEQFSSQDQWLKWWFVISAVAFIAACYSLINFYISYYSSKRLILLGPTQHPAFSAYSYICVGFISIWMSIALEAKYRMVWRFWFSFLGLFLLAMPIMTETKGVVVSIIISVSLLAVFIIKAKKSYKILFASIVGFFYLVMVKYIWGELVPRGTSYRLDIWQSGLAMMLEKDSLYLMLGNGFGWLSEYQVESRLFESPHSLLIGTLVRSGVFGLCITLFLLFQSIRVLINRALNIYSVYLPAMVIFLFGLITSLFDGEILLKPPGVWWLVLWLPIALAAYNEEYMSKNSNNIQKGISE